MLLLSRISTRAIYLSNICQIIMQFRFNLQGLSAQKSSNLYLHLIQILTTSTQDAEHQFVVDTLEELKRKEQSTIGIYLLINTMCFLIYLLLY